MFTYFCFKVKYNMLNLLVKSNFRKSIDIIGKYLFSRFFYKSVKFQQPVIQKAANSCPAISTQSAISKTEIIKYYISH